MESKIQNLKSKIATLDYGLLLALILPLFAVMPLLTHAGLPNTADGPVHLMRQVQLNEAWAEGNFYPRWGTDLALGHGMPIFSYAPPLLYQATQLFHLTGLPLDAAMKAVLVVAFLCYSGGMFLFARRVYGPYPALLAATVYVYAPYRLREAYIQGNYGQFLGLACYPLIFWAFHGLITDGRPRYLIASALSLAALLLSHNISAMLFAPLLALYLLFLLILTAYRSTRPTRPDLSTPDTGQQTTAYARRFLEAVRSPFLRTLAGGFLGLGLAAIFWLPAFGERHDIKLEGITQGFFDFRENFISLAEIVSPPLPLDLTAINPEFPLSLGLPQLIWAAVGIVGLAIAVVSKWLFVDSHHASVTSSQTDDQLPITNYQLPIAHTLFFTFGLALYAYLAVPPSQPVWEAVPLLELAEFPWRMLGPALFCATLLAAPAFQLITFYLPRFTPTKKSLLIIHSSFFIVHSSLLVAIFLTIALNAYYLYPAQFIPWGTPTPAEAVAYEITSGAIGTTSTGEFLPRWAQQHPKAEALWPDYEAGRPPQLLDPATLPAGASVESISHLAETDVVRVETPRPFEATLRSLYWPGWQLYRNGEPWPFSITDPTGLIQTQIPPGVHTLTLQLESTPLRTWGQWLSIISLIILIGVMLISIRFPSLIIRHSSFATDQLPLTNYQLPHHPISPKLFTLSATLLLLTYLLTRPLAPLFMLQSDPDRPQPADRVVRADFGDHLRLVGLDALPQSVAVGGDLYPVLYWRAIRDLETNYAVFVHLDAPNGQTFATVDERHPENIPTRNWPPGLYLRHPLHLEIPADVPPIRYDVTVGVYDPVRNERLPLAGAEPTTVFAIGSLWLTEPPPALPAQPLAHFGPYLSLWQATVEGDTLSLVWQTDRPLDPNLTIFVHLLDAEGNLLGQADGAPYAGLYPLANWLPGQPLADRRSLDLPADQKRRLNAIAIGIYETSTDQRLPAATPDGTPLPNHSFTLIVAAS